MWYLVLTILATRQVGYSTISFDTPQDCVEARIAARKQIQKDHPEHFYFYKHYKLQCVKSNAPEYKPKHLDKGLII